MDTDSLKSDLSALGKLYRLLQINESTDPSTVSKTLDEESQVFLKKLLDGAFEKVFEAHVKIMADNWRNLFDKKYMGQLEEAKEIETLHANSPNLEQIIKERVCAVIKNERPPPSVTSQVRRFTSELQSRRKKRCLACQQSSKNQSNELKNVVTKAKKSLDSVRNSGSKRMVERYLSKEVDDSIRRMESLIPSLHNLSMPQDSDAAGSYKGKQIQRCKNVAERVDVDEHRGRKPSRKYLPRFNESEETCSESTGSSSWTTEKSSSSPPPRSHTTQTTTNSNDNSEYSGDVDNQDVDSKSSRAEYVPSGSSSYKGSDYRDGDSEYYQPSRHSVVPYRKASKFNRLKNKLGLIFHHQHHHHHRHHEKRGGTAWKGFGKMMFGQKRKKAKKGGKGKQLVKSGPGKGQTGHFGALVGGLTMRARRRSSKPRQPGKKPTLWQNKVTHGAQVRLQGMKKKKKKPRLVAPKS